MEKMPARVNLTSLYVFSLINNIYLSIKLRGSYILIRELYYTGVLLRVHICIAEAYPTFSCFYNPPGYMHKLST